MFSRMLCRGACALALLLSACSPGEEEVGAELPAQEPVAAAQQGLADAYVNRNYPEYLTFKMNVIIYPITTTSGLPQPTPTQLETIKQEIEAQLQGFSTAIQESSSGLLRPTVVKAEFKVASRTLVIQNDFDTMPHPSGGNMYPLNGTQQAAVMSDFQRDFPSSTLPAMAYFVWPENDPVYKKGNFTYGNGLISMTQRTTGEESIADHEFMHLLENRFFNNGNTQMQGADNLTSTTPDCITNNPAAWDSGGNLNWTSRTLLQNLMSETKACNGAKLNYCQLITGSAKLGTPSSPTLTNFCANTGYVLNPKVSHSWIRQANYSPDWLYLEWDHIPEASTYNLMVELYNGSTVATQFSVTAPGATDRGNFRYRYFHKSEMCNAIRSAGIAGGSFNMRLTVNPASITGRGHWKMASAPVTCSYVMDPNTSQTLQGYGGAGGGPLTYTCPSGSVAVGLVGRSGPYVDALGLLCAPLNANGSPSSTATAYGPWGGTGGTYFSDRCPSGQVLVRMRGRSWSWHDQVTGDCAVPRNWITSGSMASSLPVRGGTGGTAYSQTCSTGYAITSLYLRAGAYVDYTQPRCSRIDVR